MPRLKQCKGPGCDRKSPREKMLGPLKEFCSVQCGYALSRHKQRQKWAREAKEQRRKDREWKQKNRRVSEVMSKAQSAINRFVRVRDYREPCISCGATVAEVESEQNWKVGGAWDAGHFRTRGAATHLRFNLWNINKQCKSCNGGAKRAARFSSDKTISEGYRKRLVAKIGLDRVEALENNNEPRHFDREYLERVTRIFNKRAKLYKRLRGIQ